MRLKLYPMLAYPGTQSAAYWYLYDLLGKMIEHGDDEWCDALRDIMDAEWSYA